jgi:LmbE family N-acetylglucosaminyl deacetylase
MLSSVGECGLKKYASIVVAHPDDEILWAGGFILSRPEYEWFIFALTRASDTDRAPRFFKVLELLHAQGDLGDLDDSPEQVALPKSVIQEEILHLVPQIQFEIILTHGPQGEYTSHRRHEETSAEVFDLWNSGFIRAKNLWMFAYEDDGGHSLPKDVHDAHFREVLTEEVWQKKYRLITEIYGFSPTSWEARVTPVVEAFRCFDHCSL